MEHIHEMFQGNGLKVLLVDRDPKSLTNMSRILQEHSYQVTATTIGFVALSLVVKSNFDLVICEIELPEIDGFELLKKITSQIDIPIILISASEDTQLASKAEEEGACFFYQKPIETHNLVNIWRHFVDYSLEHNKLNEGLNPTEVDNFLHGVHGKGQCLSLSDKMPLSESLEVMRNENEPNEVKESNQLSKEEKEEVAAEVTSNSTSSKKKEKARRLKWTPKLHQRFLNAYEILGRIRATPTKIMKLMNEPGLKLHHVNSYLQKYRKRLEEEKKQEATKTGMPTNDSGATRNGMQPRNPNPVLRSQNILGSYRSSLYSSPLVPTQFNPQLNIFRPSYINIQTPGNLGQNVGPNYYIRTTEAPNMVNVQNNIGLVGSVTGGEPQLLQDLNGGLGMNEDDIEGVTREDIEEILQKFPDHNPLNGGLSELNGGIGMDEDYIEGVTKEDIEELLQKFPDDINPGNGALSGGDVSACFVTGPMTPQIGTVTGEGRATESSSENLAEEDVNAFVDSLLA